MKSADAEDLSKNPQPLNRPKSVPITFQLRVEQYPEDIQDLVFHIQEVASKYVYRWKTFPITLPNYVYFDENIKNWEKLHSDYPTEFAVSADRSAPAPSQAEASGKNIYRSLGKLIPRHISVHELFSCEPAFDELDAVAADNNGELRRLSTKQLHSIRKFGTFDVMSNNFPGQVHTWRISPWLQKGKIATQDTFLNDIALALRFIIVTAFGRMSSPVFSIREAIKALLVGIRLLFDVFIGLPSLETQNLESKIREERSRYLVAELTCKSNLENSLEKLCLFIKKQIYRSQTEKFDLWNDSIPTSLPVPYVFQSPKGIEIDLRLFNRQILRSGAVILVEIVRRETRGWFLHFREKMISELRTKHVPEKEIEQRVNEAVMNEYLQRVYRSILSNQSMMDLGDGIPQLFVDQAQSTLLMNRALENVNLKVSRMIEQEKERITYENSLLSRIKPWLETRIKKLELEMKERHKWDSHEEAIALCTESHLHQTVYFLHRDYIFMREREPVLVKELKAVTIPTRIFKWVTQIWLPTNWIVERYFQGHTEVIPTILSSTSTSITMPRSDPLHVIFLVKKGVTRSTSTAWPFWRWMNYCHRTWTWVWNVMFLFGVIIPWCSPVSLRALFCSEPFCADFELSQINGTLFPRRTSLTPTLCSRLRDLWRHISKSRTHFETKPDTGFIGKGMTRQLNRIWNYIIKGLFGTLLLVLIFPMLCTFVNVACILIAITTPVWMPILTLIYQFSMGFICDFDRPNIRQKPYGIAFIATFWKIAIQGILQFFASIFVALIFCPILSVLVFIGAILRYFIRITWDYLIFHLLIKKRGRVPASNSCTVTRISGPGFGFDYYLQILPEQALAAFEAKLEYDELCAYKIQVEDLIRQPLNDFKKFIRLSFGPFSTQPAKEGILTELDKETQLLNAKLTDKINHRLKFLENGMCQSVLSKIKLNTTELKVAIRLAATMLEQFYPKYVLSRLSVTAEEYWESRGLAQNDWVALASQFFIQIFSPEFVVPLHDSNIIYKLKADSQIDLTRFTKIIRFIENTSSCPDLLGSVHTPKGNIRIDSPHIDVSAFSPGPNYKLKVDIINAGITIRPYFQNFDASTGNLYEDTCHYGKKSCMKKDYNVNKLVIPLLIPHPIQIAVIIHNREADDVIPLESNLYKEIIRVMEERAEEERMMSAKRMKESRVDCAQEVAALSSQSTQPTESTLPRSSRHNHKFACVTFAAQPEPSSSRRKSAAQRRRYHSRKSLPPQLVKVDLASPEDVQLDSDSSRIDYSTFGTTV